MRKIFFVMIATSVIASLQAQVQWRGDRTGIYNETGLMKSWPEGGPAMLWHFDGLGKGYSSVSVNSGRLYVTGYEDGRGYLYVIGTDGKLQHRVDYGPEWDDDGYIGARSTVMHDGNRLYIVNGLAELLCYDAQTLQQLWKKNYLQDYGGRNTAHGWNGPPLIVGNMLIVAPGGREHHVVALDRATGSLIWSAKGATPNDMSGYATPIYIDDQETPQVVAMMSDHIIGIDVSNGRLLWQHPHTNRFREHPNTPVYSNGMLLCTSDYGKGSVMLRLKDGGRSVEQVWASTDLCHKTGNTMKAGNCVYGSGERMDWHCVDWQTGETLYSDRTLAVGAVIAAEGLLYLYTERGEMALVRPDREKFDIISQFTVTMGTEQHWAHPVIYGGVLYVRHGDSLMAYRIKQ